MDHQYHIWYIQYHGCIMEVSFGVMDERLRMSLVGVPTQVKTPWAIPVNLVQPG